MKRGWLSVSYLLVFCAGIGVGPSLTRSCGPLPGAIDVLADDELAKGKLSEARRALTGGEKDTARAQKLLLDLVEQPPGTLSPVDWCYVYVYLGYIEDLAGHREPAIAWYRKAVTLEGSNIAGIRGVAEQGVQRPITRVRHLDDVAPRQPPAAPEEPATPTVRSKAVVTDAAPSSDIRPNMNLSPDERLKNYDILWEEIDKAFSLFSQKGIDWRKVGTRYRPKIKAAKTTQEFYRLLHELVRDLKDSHSSLCNYREGLGLAQYSPDVATRLIQGKAVVTEVTEGSEAFAQGIRRGAIIVKVDGLGVKEKVESLRPLIRVHSTERGFLETAYRDLLCGEKGSTATVTFSPPGQRSRKTAALKREHSGGWPPRRPDFPVEKGKFVWHGVHPSGCGYIWIRSFLGREEIAGEFDRALAALRETPALIVDVRDNPGGYGTAQPRIVGRFITARTKVAVSHVKNGPGHADFRIREAFFEPAGDWQYTRPVALLANAVTGSAADLFTCYMTSTGRPIHIGGATHGNLPGHGAYIRLPCDLVVRVSCGYVCNAGGKIIEGTGNIPTIEAELTVDDVTNGTDSVVERAVKELRKRR